MPSLLFPYKNFKEMEMAAIDFVHSLNIGGRNALDGKEVPIAKQVETKWTGASRPTQPRLLPHPGRPKILRDGVHQLPRETRLPQKRGVR